MPNIYDIMGNVRLRLGDPRANRPGDFQLLNQVCTEIRTIKRHERNTSNVWAFDDLVINVVPNQTTYQITAANFGTALAVVTWAPTLPTWVARLIPIYQPQNLYEDYSLPQNIGQFYYPADGSNCAAMRCSFYWTNNQPYIEFLPKPFLNASYKVRYLVSGNNVNSMALTESPLTNEDADIAEVRSALALLATTEWQSPDTKEDRAYNAERRKDLFVTLTTTERELRRQFEAAKLEVEGNRHSMRWNPCGG